MKVLFSFRESAKFTENLSKLLFEEDYSELQWELTDNPGGGKTVRLCFPFEFGS